MPSVINDLTGPTPSAPTGVSSNPPYTDPNLPTSDSASLYDKGNDQDVITDFRIHSRYERDYHRYLMGVTSTVGFLGSSAAIVQLAAPTLLWVVDWTGCRFLQKAMLPDPTTVGSVWTLLDAMLEPAAIILAPNGTTPLFRLTGTYVFGCTNPGANFFDNVVYPVVPWFNSTGISSLRTISVSDLDSTLLSTVASSVTGQTSNLGPSPSTLTGQISLSK